MARQKKRWSEYSPAQQRFIVAAATVEVALAASAWFDLARRPAALVKGPKRAWAAAIAINFFGPLAYFRWGRVQPGNREALDAA